VIKSGIIGTRASPTPRKARITLTAAKGETIAANEKALAIETYRNIGKAPWK
jgi:hypothetical protein